MMNLTTEQAMELILMVEATRDDELPCDRCVAQLAEFVDAKLTGKPFADALRLVREHIKMCRDCGEEYNVLRRAVESLFEATGTP